MIGKREISHSAVDSYRKYIQRTTIYSESNHDLKEQEEILMIDKIKNYKKNLQYVIPLQPKTKTYLYPHIKKNCVRVDIVPVIL